MVETTATSTQMLGSNIWHHVDLYNSKTLLLGEYLEIHVSLISTPEHSCTSNSLVPRVEIARFTSLPVGDVKSDY